jgi:hypothetical protein
MQKVMLAAAVATMVLSGASASQAFPGVPIDTVKVGSSAIQRVTFWGHPFPYGYNWSLVRACTRYVPVETAHGTRPQRVWVCAARKRGS